MIVAHVHALKEQFGTRLRFLQIPLLNTKFTEKWIAF